MPESVVGKTAGSGVPTAMMGRAPSTTWTAGVVRIAPPTPKDPDMAPATRPVRIPSTARASMSLRALRDGLDRLAQDSPLGGIGGSAGRLRGREPPDFLHLVVVLGDVAPGRFHQEEGHPLAHALAAPH